MVVFYNLLMLAVDALAIVTLWRAATQRMRLATVVVAAACALLAAAVGGGPFGQMRLLACGLFIHGVILSLAMAAVVARARRWAAVGWLAIALVLTGVGIDAFFIEPYWLEITRFSLRSPKIHRAVRIVAIADFQTDTLGDFERDVLRRVVLEQPDLVLFVGDYIQVAPRHWQQMVDEFRHLLRDANVTAPLGIYAVKGNIDPAAWTDLFADSTVQIFAETATVETGGLQLTGLSQPDSLNPLLHVAPTDQFHIVFGHHPDDALGDIEADLMIAGHTHGGQVRLPLIGPLLTLSRVPRSWAAGITPRDNGRTLIVSRGTGLERGNAPRLRFLCRPELVVIQIEPSN